MLTVRNILVALILASPAILAWDGLMAQGAVAGIVAVALALTALSMRPGEAEFFVSIIRAPMMAAAIPGLWLLLQLLPLGVLAHPIWASAEQALGHSLPSAISVDPAASLISLGKYLSMCAVIFLSAAVGVDRQRAEWMLFALTAAVATIALLVLAHDFLSVEVGLSSFARAPAIDCACVGVIIAGAACIRSIERYEISRSSSQQLPAMLLWASAGGVAALAVCVAALVVGAMYWAAFAAGCGLAALAFSWITRRFSFRAFGISAIIVPTLAVVLLVMAYHPPERGVSVPLAYAGSSTPLIAQSQRMLDDAPMLGTGAGTFAAVAPIYREIDEPSAGSVAATTAATFAIELGKPMFWLITVATAASIVMLLAASLRRRRDAFYPAMGAGCLIASLMVAFVDSGLLGTATELIVAAALGLAFAQSKSRAAQL
jgi:hypothetical protein